MSKLIYMLTFLIMAFSVNTYAQETCEEGQVFDPELEICVDAPAEMPES